MYRHEINHHSNQQVLDAVWEVPGLIHWVMRMILFAPTVTALQILIIVCHPYYALHDMVYNTTTTFSPMQSHGRYSAWVWLGNEELSYVYEFCYPIGHRSRWKLAEQTVIRVRIDLVQHTKLSHTTSMTQRQETLIGTNPGHQIHLALKKLKVTFSSWPKAIRGLGWPHTGEQYSKIGRTNAK